MGVRSSRSLDTQALRGSNDIQPYLAWDVDSLDGRYIRLTAMTSWSVPNHLVREIGAVCAIVSPLANSFVQQYIQMRAKLRNLEE